MTTVNQIPKAPTPEKASLRWLGNEKAAPKPANAFSASLTLGWRALLKIKHVPFQLFDVTIFPLMMTLMFTYLFGGALAGSPEQYIQFLLPGILVQAVLFITVYTGVGLNYDIHKGVYDRFRSLPIWQSSPVFGALLGDLLRYSLASIMVLGLGLLMGFKPNGGALGVILALVLIQVFSVSLSWVWIIFSMYVKNAESVMTTSFLFLFPLTFASNVFVDPTTMPAWLQKFVSINPVTHLVDASRALMHGEPQFDTVIWVLIASLALNVLFAPVALRLYHKER